MKGDKRRVYLELVGEISWTLCSFCRYATWEGSCCDDSWCTCEHPIEAVSEKLDWIGPTTDCWGFRPTVNVSDMADIVGLMLYRFDSERTLWHRERDGQLVVQGWEQRWYRRQAALAERLTMWGALQEVV